MMSAPDYQPRILVIDDNDHGLRARKGVLEEMGYCVTTAKCAETGLELYLAERFDAVVTDFRMPGMNGAELIAHIREHDPRARIVLISGFTQPLGLTEENTGADVVLSKSNREVTQLTRAVARLLSRTAPRKPPASAKAVLLARAK